MECVQQSIFIRATLPGITLLAAASKMSLPGCCAQEGAGVQNADINSSVEWLCSQLGGWDVESQSHGMLWVGRDREDHQVPRGCLVSGSLLSHQSPKAVASAHNKK